MVVQIKSGKRENGTSFWDNLYRKRSITIDGPEFSGAASEAGFESDVPGWTMGSRQGYACSEAGVLTDSYE